MKNWTNAMIERLDSAYRVRFDRDESLIFLNDAYQNLLILEMKFETDENELVSHFLEYFMEVRDLFISELVDRYPSNYHDIESKIEELHQMNDKICHFNPQKEIRKAERRTIA
ncbi:MULTISPECIES: hypothetical protein [unclassified Enterococcus]|uniref:hypothetical protein n=1 Tax=unclassified Enterococcus TaxID=2608891 RepID=UPI00155273A5|nr:MULTISPECIES: hypothetical protein [unclassified Enterococcus]MBS7578335.1 hypothetical protein [Enterococcus sp. MMGLQ5-2]MBS7585572.1 hypothetical protein [Enterococcus sp. MMGLQ5-1]NPD13431.1 hypothetical protein [Enterococcus sp. MMGLQ5-1]NPD38166.1 hypothetical protein [Enterococcus sp. MMGLQ5-2]